jgi:hypothetical protein
MRATRGAILLVSALSLFADTRTVTRTSAGDHETTCTAFVQGKNQRTECLNQDGSEAVVTIHDWERNVTYLLDLPSRKYVELRGQNSDLILTLASWIARPPRFYESGKTVNIYFETVDTGERRQFFGRTAKHLVIRSRQIADPGACGLTQESVRDGWYIPESDSRTTLAGHIIMGMASSGGRMCRDKLIFHGKPGPPGITVLERNGSFTTEVLEMSDAPLDKKLFEVPSGFGKVDSLPGQSAMSASQRLAWEWAQLERAFNSWFE